MFTGIIEAKSRVLKAVHGDSSIRVELAQPSTFTDLHRGDSIACNGVCLTVEEFDGKTMFFTIGFETLQVTAWKNEELEGQEWNLERSLKFGDRIHGHLVSGHVDGLAEVVEKIWEGECLVLGFKIPSTHSRYIWKKSSVALNGVSLTVNEVNDGVLSVCLIPETLKQTHMADLQMGQLVNIEADYYMKGLLAAQGAGHEQSN